MAPQEDGVQPDFLGVPCRAALLVWGNTSRVQPPPPENLVTPPISDDPFPVLETIVAEKL
ncbi:MAG: hypothetical protein N3E46_04170 [Gemmataceae bacterium]|nr:hypothetical protein [Gemmataceae bacterium]